MVRVSDCHEGYCKPTIDQIEEERDYSEFEIELENCVAAIDGGNCKHIISKGKEWCFINGFPDVPVTGTKYAVFSM